MALIRLDLPALRLPKMPMWMRSEDGVAFKSIIKAFFLTKKALHGAQCFGVSQQVPGADSANACVPVWHILCRLP